MKLRSILLAAVIGALALPAAAQQQWLHIYNTYTESESNSSNDDRPSGPPGSEQEETSSRTFLSIPWSSVDSIRFPQSKSTGRFINMKVFYNGSFKSNALSGIDHWTIGPNVPEFNFVTIDDTTLTDVVSKESYLNCQLTIDGRGVYDDFVAEDAKIRGRGNSTWSMPKKAYRIKLSEKTKLCGYRKAKNYVLLANYIDLSFMRNQVACLATQYVGMPYPTHALPVDVNFNGNYKGTYMLIEKVGINNGSVDLSKEDEANSIMFELDTNYDEDLKAMSTYFLLPVMHKDPDVPEGVTDAEAWFADWVTDFTTMEEAVYYHKNIADYIDYETLAKYLICYNLACNQELNHPKSVYLYKVKGGKYTFGPCWDFDWAYGYSPTYKHELDSELSDEEAQQILEALVAYVEENDISYFYPFSYNGNTYMWFGGESFGIQDGQEWYSFPNGVKNYAPSYQNFLLGAGNNNQGTSDGMGNGGEFFMSIIMDNDEFMAVYKQVWEDFKKQLDSFWADFDAYAKMLEPSAEHDATMWYHRAYDPRVDTEFEEYSKTHNSAVEILRTWVEKRIEFIDDPDNNYGLYDPDTTFTPPYKK